VFVREQLQVAAVVVGTVSQETPRVILTTLCPSVDYSELASICLRLPPDILDKLRGADRAPRKYKTNSEVVARLKLRELNIGNFAMTKPAGSRFVKGPSSHWKIVGRLIKGS